MLGRGWQDGYFDSEVTDENFPLSIKRCKTVFIFGIGKIFALVADAGRENFISTNFTRKWRQCTTAW